jgi:hypothetical protein
VTVTGHVPGPAIAVRLPAAATPQQRPAGARAAGGLRARVVPRERLSEREIARMLSLMALCYDGVDRARFRSDLAEKQEVILLLVRSTGELVGFSTVRRTVERFGSRDVEVIFSGDTVLHPSYWGAKTLTVAFVRFALARKLRRPWRPVYWFLLAGGYKTYLLMVRNLRRAWPRPGSRPPEAWRAFADGLAARWFGRCFDATRGVVRFGAPHYRVRHGIAPIDRDAARMPDIAFFAAHNPGHADGDELVCLGELRARDLLHTLVRAARSRLRARSRSGSTAPGRRPAT